MGTLQVLCVNGQQGIAVIHEHVSLLLMHIPLSYHTLFTNTSSKIKLYFTHKSLFHFRAYGQLEVQVGTPCGARATWLRKESGS